MPNCVRLSIVTVSLNSVATIRETLESVDSQASNVSEHVIVDGGSTDGTLDIVKEYAAPRRVCISEEDDGIYDAMNKGIAKSSGEVVYFLNSDDRLADNHIIHDVVRLFREDDQLDIVFGNVIYVKGSSWERRSFDDVSAPNLIYRDLCHQAVFARRRLFDRFGRFDLRYSIAADYDWLLKVFRSGCKTRYINRDIAEFNASGVHASDVSALRAERREIIGKYQSTWRYKLGETIYRVRRRFIRMGRAAKTVGVW